MLTGSHSGTPSSNAELTSSAAIQHQGEAKS